MKQQRRNTILLALLISLFACQPHDSDAPTVAVVEAHAVAPVPHVEPPVVAEDEPITIAAPRRSFTIETPEEVPADVEVPEVVEDVHEEYSECLEYSELVFLLDPKNVELSLRRYFSLYDDTPLDPTGFRKAASVPYPEPLWQQALKDVQHTTLLRRDEASDLWAVVEMIGGTIKAHQCLYVFEITDDAVHLIAHEQIGFDVCGGAGGFFERNDIDPSDPDHAPLFSSTISTISLALDHDAFGIIEVSGAAFNDGDEMTYNGEFTRFLPYYRKGAPRARSLEYCNEEPPRWSWPAYPHHNHPRDATYCFGYDYIDNSRPKEQECHTVKGEFELEYDADAGELLFQRTYTYRVVGEDEEIVVERGHVWNPEDNVFAERCGLR
ncbi:MAG: hypothetical protein ACNA8W_00905 [Bradymonadaceae bacterium]